MSQTQLDRRSWLRGLAGAGGLLALDAAFTAERTSAAAVGPNRYTEWHRPGALGHQGQSVWGSGLQASGRSDPRPHQGVWHGQRQDRRERHEDPATRSQPRSPQLSPLAPHNPQGPCSLAASYQIAASIPNFLIQERGDNNYEDLLAKPLPPVEKGFRPLLTDPGLGIAIDEEKLKAQVGEPTLYRPRFDPDDNSVLDW
jgi:hypothetical protein